MIDSIDLLLTNEIHTYFLSIAEAQIQYCIKLRLSICQKLAVYISPYTQKLIAPKYHSLIKELRVFMAYINMFSTTTGLLCSHKIQKQLYWNDFLMLKDIYLYWS